MGKKKEAVGWFRVGKRVLILSLGVWLGTAVVGGALVGQESLDPIEGADEETGAAAVSSLANLEWRGVMALEGRTEFSLRNPAAQTSIWVGLGETNDGVKVIGYDPKDGTLTVSNGKETRDLFLSGGTVTKADPAQLEKAAEPAPLVETPGVLAEKALEQEEGEVVPLLQDREAPTEAGVEESVEVEIDEQVRELRLEAKRVAEAMTQVPEDAPEFRLLEERKAQIEAEEQKLAEGGSLEEPEPSGQVFGRSTRRDDWRRTDEPQ